MNVTTRRDRGFPPPATLILLALLPFGLAGCGANSKTTAGPATASTNAPAQDEGWVGRANVTDAIAFLNQGQSDKARKVLVAALKKQPGDTIARRLLDQIDLDPRVLLGTENYSYTLKTDDTLSSLAQRFLGDPMLFYALSRYNGLTLPTQLSAGQTILIPGKRKPAPVEPRRVPVVRKPPPGPTVAKPAPPKPVTAPTNPGLAAKLRGQGLAALNGGAINRAVALFRQALSLDPANATIKGDLVRALRVQNTLRAHR
jgi:tetratricopeptide (TPR) repeat protein